MLPNNPRTIAQGELLVRMKLHRRVEGCTS
jgi:hypothetical protein